MPLFDISDAGEFKDATMEAKPDDLIVLTFYDSSSRDSIETVEKLANTTAFEEITFFQAELSENKELAELYHVKSVPVSLFMKTAKVIDRLVGEINEDALNKKLFQNN